MSGLLGRTVRRRLRRLARGAVTALPPSTRELALALATRSGGAPRVLPGPPDGPVLVLAPHPDDEVIGPGGTLARHLDAGDDVRVVVLTSGGATSGGGADVTMVREEESRRALTHLGTVAVRFTGLTDGGLGAQHDKLVAAIETAATGVRTVYVPSLLDPHPDHRAAAVALAATALPDDVLVLGYEVWAAGPVDVLVDVTGVFARKQAALAEYVVALQTVDYVRSSSGLAAYRSASGSMGGRGFAEGFTAMTLAEHRTLVAGLTGPVRGH